ncbi:hypothetical protein [Phyllobacterium bourgognense]|uniref:Uncharacterized protein n=1 Tax=Phyllobacterium bourgognense TaxID=314236 RepID=A0A368YJF2_9HYPH|nr:hypothetical protein [Phyllobacterium bourgognense]RCW80305.1 hypothetical protein C7476_11419 [Phyllobacterium bourgognense]
MSEPATTMIAVVVFDKDDSGTLYSVGEPQAHGTEELAVSAAKELASQHDGVIAWKREGSSTDDAGRLTILYKAGEAIDME